MGARRVRFLRARGSARVVGGCSLNCRFRVLVLVMVSFSPWAASGARLSMLMLVYGGWLRFLGHCFSSFLFRLTSRLDCDVVVGSICSFRKR